MYLSRLTLVDFKNLPHAELTLNKGVNAFVGNNGAGKSNLLDAIHFLSQGRSSTPATDAQSIRRTADGFAVTGHFCSDKGRSERVTCSYVRATNEKILKRNDKEYDRLSDHVGRVPIVWSSPADSALIWEGGEQRRRYLNALIAQLDGAYLAALVRYNAVLAERNRLLKSSPSEEMLQIYDAQLCAQAVPIHARRAEIVEQLAPKLQEYYSLLADQKEQVALTYKSALNETSAVQILQQARERDYALGFTTAGVHRDDLELTIDGFALRKFGSQGQQKSFLIALRLAQHALTGEQTGERPLLLLDDLFDKLDDARVEALLRLVATAGQVLITDCHGERLRTVLAKAAIEHTLYRVENGKIDATE